MNKTIYDGWAIDANSDEGHGLLGRFWWREKIPYHMMGHRIAMFPTRAWARAALKDVKPSFPKAKVVPVIIRIDERKKREAV